MPTDVKTPTQRPGSGGSTKQANIPTSPKIPKPPPPPRKQGK
jgi:hypothetical protein